LYPCLS